jgi:hypothetical protein
LAPGGTEGAITVDDRTLKERGILSLPGSEARFIDRLLQEINLLSGLKAAAEVSGGGGIGETVGPERVEIGGIAAQGLDVFDAGTASKDVEGDVEDMVGFVIGLVLFEDVDVGVDMAFESESFAEAMEEGHPTAGDG